MEIEVSAEVLLLLEARVLAEMQPKNIPYHTQKYQKASRSRTYQHVAEQAPPRILPIQVKDNEVGFGAKRRICCVCQKQLATGMRRIFLRVHLPVPDRIVTAVRLCSEVCLIRFAHHDTELERLTRVRELETTMQTEIEVLKAKYEPQIIKAKTPKVKFCTFCRNPFIRSSEDAMGWGRRVSCDGCIAHPPEGGGQHYCVHCTQQTKPTINGLGFRAVCEHHALR